MRIVHTADWHLCDRLGPRIDRTADLQSRVERVAALCEEYAADVLLVAGDLFSKQESVEDMTAAMNHIRKTFAPFFARGGTFLAITGNHDRDDRIDLVREGMMLASPPTAAGGRLTPGRMYLVNGKIFGTLECRPGDAVQFVCVPYPFASRYDLSAADYRSREEETRLLHARVVEWIQQATAKLNPALPTVLTAHLHVRGSELHSLHRITERDDVLFDFADLMPQWAYVALGHIHKPQCLGGSPTVRYPGSLDRLDFGEAHDPGVLLVDVNGSDTVVHDPLPIPATPFHTIDLADPEAELPTLAEKYADRATAIVRLNVSPPSGDLSRDEITRELRKLFPRLHDLKWTDTAAPDAAPSTLKPHLAFEPTVRDYLAERLSGDTDRDAVLALAESFLKATGES